MLTRRTLLASGAALLATGRFPSVAAGAYPSRPITIIVPTPPGSNAEVVLRLVGDRLTASLGQPIVIEHRPGAGGLIGARVVAGAAPNGYTLLFSTPGPLVVSTAVYRNPGYDPRTSFAPIATLFSSPQMLVVDPSIPVSSVAELVSYAKANPGRLHFGSPGYGTQPHLLGEMLRLMTDIQITHVPYKGPAEAIRDLLAGQVQMYFETIALLLPFVESGQLRALAVADQTRTPQLPQVRTTGESGYAAIQAVFWSGVLAPAGTPDAIVAKLNREINAALAARELEESLAKLSAKTKIGSPTDFAAFIESETRKWSGITTAAGIRVE